jgi:1-acyl-sn-glycerol-3-phosphate acyltransferase
MPFVVLVIGPLSMLFHFLFFNRELDNKMIMLWGRITCRWCGVRVIVEGEQHIPPDGGCLMLFNHASFFDIFALAGYISGIRFGAKAELFKLPVFGKTMKAMGTLPIARNNPEEVYKIYEEAKERFKKGEMFALAPEGGRFFKPDLAPFKAGPFLFAISAGAPIVPVMILGAYEILPKGHILFNNGAWSRTIHLKILDPIETKDFTQTTRRELQKIVYDKMNAVWREYYQK